MKNLIIALILPSLATAGTIQLTWSDNSDNEDGFVFEALQAGEWVEVGRVEKDVTTFALVDSEKYEGARVWAFNDWGRSTGAATNLKAGSPTDLKPVRKIETTKSTTTSEQTTVTEFQP